MEVCNVHPFRIKEIPRYSMSDKYVGLLLITYNDAENLDKALQSLFATIDYPTIIYCMDMGSTDGTIDLLKEFQEIAVYDNPYVVDVTIHYDKNLSSLTSTMNRGFKWLMARQECDYIGWIHPDAIYEPNWLSELVSTLNVHPEIGKICSHNTRDGLPNYVEPKPGHEQIYIIRRGVLLKVGLFDERFIGIGGAEDLDLNYRIIREGWKVAISPTSHVNHIAMGTRSKRDTSQEQLHNRTEFIKKWGSWFDGEMFI